MNFYNVIFSRKWSYRLERHAAFWLSVFLYHCLRLSLFFPAGNFLQNMPSIINGALTWGVLTNMVVSYSMVYYLIPTFFVKKKYLLFIFCVIALFIVVSMFSMFSIL